MAEFRFDPVRNVVVEIVEKPVEGDVETRLQEEADQLQNSLNNVMADIANKEEVYAGKVREVEAASLELEQARDAKREAEEAIEAHSKRRASWVEAMALGAQLAESDPESEFEEDEEDGSVDIPVTVAPEASV